MTDENQPETDSQMIPAKFHSYETGRLFSNCMICETDLLGGHTHYIIEKSIRRYPDLGSEDIIYEYAICFPCALEQKKAMSEESVRKIEAYFSKRFHPANAFLRNMSMEERLTNCLMHGDPIDHMTEYVLQASCIGNQLFKEVPPFVIGEKAMQEISSLLSIRTRDEIDRFIDKWFSGPPEFKSLLKNRKVVFL